MKMQNCKWDFFPLLIWLVGKRGMTIKRNAQSPYSDFSEVAIERLYISFELTGIWNVIDRFPVLNHYLLFDCNVSLFLLLQYCLHFTFLKRVLIEPYRGRYFYLSARSMKTCLQVPGTSVHTTIMDFSPCWLKALFLCYLSILYLLLDCNIKSYLTKHWNNSSQASRSSYLN